MSVLTLGQYATAWRAEPLGRLAPRSKACGTPDLEPLSVFLGAGVVPRATREDNRNELGADLTKYLTVRPGDIVFNKLRTWQGGLGVSHHLGIVSPAYYVLTPSDRLYPGYAHYLLQSAPYLAEFTRLSKWMPPSQFDIGWEQLREVPVLLPPLKEQRRIADFLDDQVTRIDAAVSARRRGRLLVEEQFSAWMDGQYDAFVRGVGAEPLRRHLLEIRQGWSPQCDDRRPESNEWGVLKSGCVNGGRFDPTQVKTLPDGVEPRLELLVRAGDLLVNRASGSLDLIGSAAVVDDKIQDRILLCDKVYRLRLAPSLDPAYYAAMWATSRCREELKLSVSGAEGMANSLPSPVIRSIRLPVPSLPAQQDWLVQFRARAAARDALAAASARQEELLQERKRALITAAVMGEFDVSSAGPRTTAAVTA